MRNAVPSLPRRLLLALAAAGGIAASAQAQTFEADYELVRPAAPHLRLSPVIQSGTEAPGVGLSFQGSSNWFGQVGVGRQPVTSLVGTAQIDVLNVGGGGLTTLSHRRGLTPISIV